MYFGDNAERKCLPQGYDCLPLGLVTETAKLVAAYAAADVFVSPSFQDNLPNTVNEALSCGTPVVCFDKSSSEDVVTDGVNGFLAKHPGLPLAPDGTLLREPLYSVAPEKLAPLAKKIQKILELPPDEYAHMRKRCWEHALTAFAPVLQTARYLRLFRAMLRLPAVHIDGLPQ
jgi:glycosyltransferase involved in cell wall biosynthesis